VDVIIIIPAFHTISRLSCYSDQILSIVTIIRSIATMTTKKIVILKLLTEIERKHKKKKKKYILVECIFFIPLQSIIASKLHFQINITR